MHEDIRKPKLLKDVPLLLIRPLPVIYYFGRYAQGDIPEHISELVSGNIRYLRNAQNILGENIRIPAFFDLAEQFNSLCASPPEHRRKLIDKLMTDLSNLCTKNRLHIRTAMQKLRAEITDSYKKMVPSFALLFVDYSHQENDSKIVSLLKNFCFYNAQNIQRSDRNYSEYLVKSDFVIFNSTHPALIHGDVLSLNDYRKPGLAVVEMVKDRPLETQTVRHAMQLLRTGFQVLFKVFTPIRLFTSVDREYVRFHLS